MTDFSAYVRSHPEDKTLQAMWERMQRLEAENAALRLRDSGRYDGLVEAGKIAFGMYQAFTREGDLPKAEAAAGVTHAIWLRRCKVAEDDAALDADDGRG